MLKRKFQKCFQQVQRLWKVSRLFLECFKGVSRNFKEFQGRIQRSFMIYGTHRGSPEKKNGLFDKKKCGLRLMDNEMIYHF